MTPPKLPPKMRRVRGRYFYYSGHIDPVTGKRKSIPLGADYGAALARWAELEGASDGDTVGDAIDRYIASREFGALKPRSQKLYLSCIRSLRPVFGRMRLAAVTPGHIARYLRESKYPVAANRQIAVLSTIMALAVETDRLLANPCKQVRRNRERSRDRYITPAEFDRLREAADAHWSAVIDLAYLTALRRGDLLALRPSDATDEGIEIAQGKTGGKLCITWTPALRATWNRLLETRRAQLRPTVIATKRGRPYKEGNATYTWDRLRERAGLEDIHFHDIRGTALTDAERNEGLDYAQALGGHDSQQTTEGYLRKRKVARVRPLR